MANIDFRRTLQKYGFRYQRKWGGKYENEMIFEGIPDEVLGGKLSA